MMRFWLWSLLLVVAISPVFASNDAIETARENCNRVESPLDVPAACEVHVNCLFNSATINCTEFTLVQLITSCSSFDARTCVDVATLTMVAIDDAILNYQTIDATVQLNNSLVSFLNQEYQTAIDLYENVTLSLDYFPHYIFELGLGILYLRFDNPDVARIQFDKSLNLEFYNPVAFYYRGNTYQQIGNGVRALRDHYMYDLLADAQLKPRLPLRAFTIQIPNSEQWSHYPVYTLDRDDVFFSLQDDSRVPVRPIVISFVDNDETLVIADWLDIVAGAETEILFLERDPQNPLRYILNINQQDVPNSVVSSKTEISVLVAPTHLDLYLRSTQNNAITQIAGIAREIPEDDPRASDASGQCDTASLSLLTLGTEVAILNTNRLLLLYDEPTEDSQSVELIAGEMTKPFTVTDGFVCETARIWWQISNGTQSGWLPEHDLFEQSRFQMIPAELRVQWSDVLPTPLQYLNTTSD